MTTTKQTTDLKGRSFLKELDFTPEEWLSLLDLAAAAQARAPHRSRTGRSGSPRPTSP